MYIELFLLDNTLMNLLVLRAAGALLARRPRFWPLLGASFLGAVYGALSIRWPLLGSLPMGLLPGLAMALVFLAKGDGLPVFLGAFAAVLGACFLVGGMGCCLMLAMERGMGLSLRGALLCAVLAAFLPRPIRSLLRRRGRREDSITVEHRGERFTLPCMTDTGNLLFEPLSGLPVAVAHLPALSGAAHIPVPVNTVSGPRVLYALRPERALYNGALPLDILIALSPEPLGALLLPPAALTISKSEVSLPC